MLACLIPLGALLARAAGLGSLGANPVEEVLHTLGKTGLNLLLITLAVTPVRRLTGRNWLVALRRTLGLFAFAYVALHATTYAVLDQGLAWASLLVDVTQRPYITLGFLALVLMVPLAITSTNAMQRRLGRRWVTLHKTVYVVAVLGSVHFLWQVKADIREPLIYLSILAALLGFRVLEWIRRRGRLGNLSRS